jgi:MAC/Perforin domain/Hemopexin
MAARAVKQDKATSHPRHPQSAPESTTSVPPSATEPASAEATTEIHAVVTGPVSKKWLPEAGFAFPGQTPTSPSPDGGATAGPANSSGHNAGEVGPQLIPGASVVGRGIYLRPRQPYELKGVLFESGEPEAQFVGETGRTYLVPKSCLVNNSPPAPADQSLGETVIEESWDRLAKELTVNVKAAVGSNLISIDPTAFRATQLRSEEDSYYALRSSFIAFWNLSLINVPSLPTLEKEVANLPKDPLEPKNREEYARVFEKYGSHYVKSAWVGGKASLVFIVAKSSQLTKEDIRSGIQATVGGIAKGEMSNAQETVGDRFKTNSTCKVFGSGGDRLKLAQLSSMQEGAYKQWIETVKDNPQVIELGLSGIWTLVKDQDKADDLKVAYTQATSFSPLSAIIPITSTSEAGMETNLTFLKGDEVFEYRRRLPPGERIHRNPAGVVKFKRDLARVPSHSKFARPDGAISLNGFGKDEFGKDLDDALYLFKHRECLRVDVNTLAVIKGYPKEIGEEWPGVDFDRIDAALTVAPDKIYFFRGPNYIRVDKAEGKPSVVGSRDLIKKRWAGVSFDRVDTAVYWGNSKVYLFYEDQYIRYDMATFRADPGYPRFIESNYIEDWELFG